MKKQNEGKKYIKTVTTIGTVSIPITIRRELGIEAGDTVVVQKQGDMVFIKRIEV